VPFVGLGPAAAAWLPAVMVVGQTALLAALNWVVLAGALAFSLWRVERLGD
jgi:hypothetical protein